jgi:hypothetical protein
VRYGLGRGKFSPGGVGARAATAEIAQFPVRHLCAAVPAAREDRKQTAPEPAIKGQVLAGSSAGFSPAACGAGDGRRGAPGLPSLARQLRFSAMSNMCRFRTPRSTLRSDRG